MIRSSNPALSQKVFEQAIPDADRAAVMTVEGSVNRTMLLLVLAIIPAYYVYGFVGDAPTLPIYLWGGLIGGLIFALITIFKKTWAPVTGPLYAIAEGFFLGAISLIYESAFHGIVPLAMTATFGTLLVMLLVYRTGLIKVTDRFRAGITAAVGAVFLIYMVSWILSFFGVPLDFLYGSGWISIGFSVVVVGIAALSLVLDFDFIARGAQAQAPKYLEWYAAFGLMVTIVWLYLEILRLLAKLRGRE